MRYPYLTLLALINIASIAILEMIAFYILIKLFKKDAKLKTIIKSFWLFVSISIGVSILNYVFSFSVLFSAFNLGSVVITTGLFLAFYYILRKFLSMNWKRSLLIFFICFFFVFPLISDFIIFSFTKPLTNKQPFKEEFEQLTSDFETHFNLASLMFYGPQRTKLSLILYSWNLLLVGVVANGLHGISSQDMFLMSSGVSRLLELLKPTPY